MLETIALATGVAWASGLNVYATVLVLGVAGSSGQAPLPADLEVLSHPLVIGAAGLMFAVEFLADKVPGVDSAWDALHTFIRIPAGIVLAVAAIGDVSVPVQVAAALVAGGIAAGTHGAKAGGRVLINTSPEPVSNWVASSAEDLAVFVGLSAALWYPLVFCFLFLMFVIAVLWLAPKIWRGLHAMGYTVGRWWWYARGSPRRLAGPHDGPTGEKAAVAQCKGLLDEPDKRFPPQP